MDTGDYNFKGAIDDIKERYGLDDAGLEKVDQAMRDGATRQRDFIKTLVWVSAAARRHGSRSTPKCSRESLADPNVAERSFREAAGMLGVRQEGQMGGGSIYALLLMLQAYQFAN